MTPSQRLRFTATLPLLALALGCQTVIGTVSPTTSQILTAVPLQVYAAASLTDAFKVIGEQYSASHRNTLVAFKFAGSQDLVAQIHSGAQADVFASADRIQMDTAIETARASASAVRTFVKNRLVIVQPLRPKTAIKTVSDLASPNLTIVAAQADVPVGRYTIDFLDKASRDPQFGAAFKGKVAANIVSYEANVRLVLDKVIKGTADAGIVYVSDVIGSAKGKVTTVAIPAALNVTATYPIAVTAPASRRALAQTFVDHVVSSPAQAVLKDYGFIPAADTEE